MLSSFGDDLPAFNSDRGWNRPSGLFRSRSEWGNIRVLRPRPFPETRASLLATLHDGEDAVGWQEFFERYAPAVYRVARMRGVDPHLAEDVVQQVMMTVAREIRRFDYDRDRGRFRQWVRLITENKIKNQYRKKLPEEALGEDVADDAPSMDQVWQEQWRLQDIIYCLDEIAVDFSPRRIEAFRLYVLEGLPANEVAQRLSMTVGHVYVVRTLILHRLRARLASLSADES